MNTEEKAKAYDRAYELAEGIHRFSSNPAEIKRMEEIFPELKESEDERIRKELISFVRGMLVCHDKPNAERDEKYESWIAWLEKQGEQNHCMIQWKGDNLKEVIEFTGKDKNFEKWFKSFEEYEKYVQEHDGIFKLFNADGSHYEVPVGAWIVKTPDGYNVASKAIFRQKSVDTPRFKVGDWVVVNNKHQSIYQVEKIENRYYILRHTHGGTFRVCVLHDESLRLWDISDAKDGDVLAYGDNPNDCHVEITMIFKSVRNEKSAFTHFHIFDDKFRVNDWCDCGKNAHPATKEQRDLLFQKMNNAGFTFDFEKKALKNT